MSSPVSILYEVPRVCNLGDTLISIDPSNPFQSSTRFLEFATGAPTTIMDIFKVSILYEVPRVCNIRSCNVSKSCISRFNPLRGSSSLQPAWRSQRSSRARKFQSSTRFLEFATGRHCRALGRFHCFNPLRGSSSLQLSWLSFRLDPHAVSILYEVPRVCNPP